MINGIFSTDGGAKALKYNEVEEAMLYFLSPTSLAELPFPDSEGTNISKEISNFLIPYYLQFYTIKCILISKFLQYKRQCCLCTLLRRYSVHTHIYRQIYRKILITNNFILLTIISFLFQQTSAVPQQTPFPALMMLLRTPLLSFLITQSK